MNHSFNIDVAKKYGIEEAIILENFYFWIEKNKANEKNFHDGYYWTYNSQEAFSKLFPYLSKHKIYRVMKKLEDEGLIIKGNYNKIAYDRTTWYAITDKALSVFATSISQNCEMDVTELRDRNRGKVSPIPDINTDIKTDINTYSTNDKIKRLFELYNEQGITKHKSITQQMRKRVNARLKEQSLEDLENVITNYSKIYKDDKYFYKVKLRFDELMGPDRVARFLDESEPFEKHLDYNKKKQSNQSEPATIKDVEPIKEEIVDLSKYGGWNG